VHSDDMPPAASDARLDFWRRDARVGNLGMGWTWNDLTLAASSSIPPRLFSENSEEAKCHG
jgi:hypothetical protein